MALNTTYDITDFELAVRAAGVDFGTTINESDIRLALREFGFPPGVSIDDSDMRRLIREYVGTLPDIQPNEVDPVAENIISGQRTIEQAAEKFGGEIPVDPDEGVTDTDPVDVGDSTIPQGARLVTVKDPKGADADKLHYLVYQWRGLELAFEVGDTARFRELFGSIDNFADVRQLTQTQFDNQEFTLTGSADELLGSTESLGSQIEREVRALGLEDLPAWLSGSSEALALTAQATAQGWSSGRLWKELSGTQAFVDRFGAALDRYLQGGTTISQATAQLVADEQQLKQRLLPFAPPDSLTTENLQSMLSQGWTADSASRVLEQASILESDPAQLSQANQILEASNLPSLDEVEFINALNGHGPPEVVEALNTIAAGQALEDAGLDDVDLDLLMDVVDTSDRLLTVDSFSELTQQLAFNFARFGRELETEKLGLKRDDVVAALFGEESPSGKTPGETLNMLARFERDRKAAAQGFEATSAGIDREGRLRIQGLAGL